ncbi:MAG: IS1380 family transposase [Ketobacter sp.]|nr:IS1380 family transposase [Ketobacter sp.]
MSKKSKQKRSNALRKWGNRIQRRLKKRHWEDQPEPMFKGGNIHYEMSEKTRAMNYGGIGLIHTMVKQIGLDKELNRLELLKFHVPYHESDHVLNIAYNVLLGGKRLEDIELRRNDEVYLDALGAQRIPDPTTAGDFTRRFDESGNQQLMDAINEVRARIWPTVPGLFRGWTYIDVDGTLAGTLGECKQGMDISYKGIWGYHPLIISLAKTKEVLYIVNRPGNVASHQDSAKWLDRSISLVSEHAKKLCVRGDTDFSLTAHFDRWSEQVDFIFGMDAQAWLVNRAEALSEAAWEALERAPKYRVKTEERERPENVKERIVREREFKNIRLLGEAVAEFDYRPLKCAKTYRMVVVRKNLSVEKGEQVLFDDIRYFFYITTRRDITAAEVVKLANERCDQENINEQLKNGVNAMRLPVEDLDSNWAYMIMAALAWNLKAWLGLLMPNRARGWQIVRMEFRRFLHAFILIPCQIIRTGRKIVFRLLSYKKELKDLFRAFEKIRSLQLE